MKYTKTKNTKRFAFQIDRNTTAKKAGSNTVTISTQPSDGQYNVGQSSLVLTVREAKALNIFLADNLSSIDVG